MRKALEACGVHSPTASDQGCDLLPGGYMSGGVKPATAVEDQ
jgi:hypothetical protein